MSKIIGNLGEDLAVQYLRQQGYVIIKRNVKISYYEIDIIASKDGKISFVEVKTKNSPSDLWEPEDLMDKRKLKNFKEAVMHYCQKNHLDLNNINLELIAINSLDNLANIKHYLNVI